MEIPEISSLSYFLVQVGGGNDAVVEVADVQLFVRRMGVFIRQADAKKHGGQPELVLERRDDRDRAAFASENRRPAESLLDRPAGSLHVGIVERRHPRLATVHPRNLQ